VRSRADGCRRLAFLAVVLVAALRLSAQSPPERVAEPGNSPNPAQIAQALDKVKADPNLATERSVRTLRWLDASDPNPRPPPGWFHWIIDLFMWLAQSSRYLIWVIIAVLASFLVLYIARIVRTRGMPRRAEKFSAPSHVRDLDIRPESLPADIGAAARALWDRAEHRAALALLYRGFLSRLVHVHGIPIRDSSTEGDCLALAAPRLNEARGRYASRLVRIWQLAVYGGEEPDSAAVHALCDGFAAALDAAPAAHAGSAGTTLGLST
jgi:Domain of unknown function (DUF4129)